MAIEEATLEMETAGGVVLGILLGVIYTSLWWRARVAERALERVRTELDVALDESSTHVETFALGRSDEAL